MIGRGSDGRSRRALVLMSVALLIPLVIGWVVVWNGSDDDDAGLAEACALWDAQGANAYVMTLEIQGMAGVGWGTVPELFDDIEQALRNGSVSQLIWHPELGCPAAARLDPEADAIDDEWGFRVEDLETLATP